jgi:uncharacterized protein YndB with AHSA1/START domain
MPDILHDFPIQARCERVFDFLVSPAGLAAWWTKRGEGRPGAGERYRLWFGPDHDWAGVIRVYRPPTEVEWEITEADADWRGTRVGFRLEADGDGTRAQFHHAGWAEPNAHFRTSSFCWAMYLRILRRHLELGEVAAYEDRLSA